MPRLVPLLAAFIGLWSPHAAQATIGLAEWSAKAPGNNEICHQDPHIEKHGTCLLPSGTHTYDNQTIYVSHLEWWKYLKGHVVGKATRGYFIFNEQSKAVNYFDTEESLQTRLNQLHLGRPLTHRLTNSDGWYSDWGMPEMCPYAHALLLVLTLAVIGLLLQRTVHKRTRDRSSNRSR